MKKYAIIVAGGTGTRMQGDIPKQFMPVAGKPVMLYSIEAFYTYDSTIDIILAVHTDYIDFWKTLCEKYKISIPFRIAEGGATRFDSVKNALQIINNDGYVAIHDAARPMITADFVQYLFSEAEKNGSSLPGIALNETIRMMDGDSSFQIDRSRLRAMQTPQVFKYEELKQAYTQSYNPLFTDDAAVMQSAGFQLHLCEGLTSNIKITNPTDLILAETFLKIS